MGNSIKIKIVIEEGRLEFKCRNTYQNRRSFKQDFGGLGNELIAKRLMLLYPDRHSLKFTDTDGVYQVELSLNLYGD